MGESVDSLKQRLVGAFVILSLAIIFLPMLFDKPHREGSAAVQMVPPKPRLETVVISKPKPLDLETSKSQSSDEGASERAVKKDSVLPQRVVEKAATQDSSVVKSADASSSKSSNNNKRSAKSSDSNSPTADKPNKAKSVSSKKPKVYSNVWMVQLGTFSNSENAYALRDKLRAAGIDGHTKKLSSGKAIRVFAGPFVTKKEALRIKRKVDAEFKIDSLVLFFEA